MRFAFALCAAIALSTTTIGRQQPAPNAPAQKQVAPRAPSRPCSASEARQLDFWVGDWQLSWPNPAKAGETLHGTNHVTREFDGCVIEENFSGGTSIPLRGRSVSVFNGGKWHQTWVDNQGSYIDLAGEFREGQIILAREVTLPSGTRLAQRMVFKNITADSFDWVWERSTDNGETWAVVWPIHYQRVK